MKGNNMKNIYLKKFRHLLTQNKVDALLIYANGYDDRFMRALSGTYSILQDYVFLTPTECIISEPEYLIPETQRRTNVEMVSAGGEDLVIEPIAKILGPNKRIGVVGNCRFRDVKKLNPSTAIDLTTQADEIIRFKTDEFINKISKPAGVLAKIVKGVEIFPRQNQLELDKKIKQDIMATGSQLAFPPCVTSGNDLRISTCLSPSDKKFENQDMICIDAGLKSDIFTTDMTRMFFLGNPVAESICSRLMFIHREIISNIRPELKWSQLISEYQKRFSKITGVDRCLKEDFGHGIGFGLHEQPMIDRSQEKIGKNIVFTIEPTVVTKFGMMRFEDMIAIDSKGRVKILME
jgi:Xaa-Pro aminopeptidase